MLTAIEGIKYEVENIAHNMIRVYGVGAIAHMKSIFNGNHNIVVTEVKEGGGKHYRMRILGIVCINYKETYVDIVFKRS